MNLKVRNALRAIDDARSRLRYILMNEYPIGTSIEWQRGTAQVAEGLVLEYAPEGNRVKVRNTFSGKEFWIYARDIV
ncbi:MAG: hypothetical protein V3V96_15520 [Acidiferrobacterales bacterium]